MTLAGSARSPAWALPSRPSQGRSTPLPGSMSREEARSPPPPPHTLSSPLLCAVVAAAYHLVPHPPASPGSRTVLHSPETCSTRS